MAENIEDPEEQLVNYLKRLLRYQIVPVDFMHLRRLVLESPKSMLIEFVQEQYPDLEFLTFLLKYPNIFHVDAKKSVRIVGPNYCTIACSTNALPSDDTDDEVDGKDKQEYTSGDSDSDSDKSDSEKETLLNRDNKPPTNADGSEDRMRGVTEPSSSSCTESSDNFSSSEIIQTSDSLSSSLSSLSSSEN